SEDEIGTLLRFAGAIWAREALGIEHPAPNFDLTDIRKMAEAVREVPVDEPLPLRGIGRSLDRVAGSSSIQGSAAEKITSLREYLVAAAAELVSRSETEKSIEEAFPAAAALRDSKSVEGLNAAIEEHMAAAGLTTGGKVRLRDGRSGEQFMSPITV